MQMLVLGGAWSLGRLVVEGAAHRGFAVTAFNRGPSTFDQGRGTASPIDGVRFIHGDRRIDGALRELARLGPWDVVVDIDGKVPAVVHRSAHALKDVGERYLSVSTNLVYRDWPHAPVDESSPLRDGDPDFDSGAWRWEPELYGSMKLGCEMACRDAFGDERVLILRLHEMIGQHEDDGPLRWWLNRMRRGGAVLVPAPDRPIQPIDVRDVAFFIINLVMQRVTGVLNVAAPHGDRTYGSLVRACAEVVAHDTAAAFELVWVDEDWLLERGVRQRTELPLWHNAAAPWDMNVERALAVGLKCRPFLDTAAHTWRWLSTGDRNADHPRFAAYGIDPEREADLIARWRATAR